MARITLYTDPGDLTLLHTASPPPAGSVLAAAAQTLAAGATVNIPIPSYAGLGLTGDGLDWNTRMHFDNVRGILHLMWKAANQTDDFRYAQYDENANQWFLKYRGAIRAGGGNGDGHAYDCGALDEALGEFYFLAGYAWAAVKWDGAAFVRATGAVMGSGTSNDSSSPRGQSWAPNLWGPGDGGIIHVRGSGSGGGVMAWRRSSGPGANFVKIGNVPYSGIRHSEGVYCPLLDQQILSMGTEGLACLRVIGGAVTGGNPVAVQNPFNFPIPVTAFASGGDANMARLLETPSGSVAVFESASPGRVWRFNTDDLTMPLQSFTHPMRGINSSWPTAFLRKYGVYLSLRETDSGGLQLPTLQMYRPPAGL